MALVNVKKKVEKARDKLGLQPGEEVLGGCTTNPKGNMKRLMAWQLGGAIGAAIAARGNGDAPADGGIAARFPSAQSFVCLTDQRLVVTSVALMSGSPKELTAEFSKAEVAAIEVDGGVAAMPITIAFSDGTAVQVEGARMSNPAGLAELYETWK